MRVVVAALLVASISPALAQFYDGNEFYQRCQGANPPIFCLGYVTGVADLLTEMERAGVWDFPACRPANATNGQILDIVLRFLAAHPEIRHQPMALLSLGALQDAFPCPSRGGAKPAPKKK